MHPCNAEHLTRVSDAVLLCSLRLLSVASFRLWSGCARSIRSWSSADGRGGSVCLPSVQLLVISTVLVRQSGRVCSQLTDCSSSIVELCVLLVLGVFPFHIFRNSFCQFLESLLHRFVFCRCLL